MGWVRLKILQPKHTLKNQRSLRLTPKVVEYHRLTVQRKEVEEVVVELVKPIIVVKDAVIDPFEDVVEGEAEVEIDTKRILNLRVVLS